MGLGQASRRPRIKPSARSRWRLPPTTSSAEATSRRATGDSPATPSSPMPMMDSQRVAVQVARSLFMARPAMRVLDPRRHHGSLGAGAAARRRSALRRDAVARRPHDHAAGAADRHPHRRLRRRRGSRPMAARAGDRRGDRCHASLCRPDSANAVAACAQTGVPLASIVRLPWTPQPGDPWRSSPTCRSGRRRPGTGAAPRLPQPRPARPPRLRRGAAAPLHRALRRPPSSRLPPDMRFLQARGPFDLAAESAAARDEKIDVIVSKNSGGGATYRQDRGGARARPAGRHDRAARTSRRGHVVDGAEAAIAWLDGSALTRRSLRGV